MSGPRILVTGSRNLHDWRLVEDALLCTLRDHCASGEAATLVVGDCWSGADYMAWRSWDHHDGIAIAAGATLERRRAKEQFKAAFYGVGSECFPATYLDPLTGKPWCYEGHRRTDRYGQTYCPKKGPERNQRMVDSGADVCLAFPLGRSAGTRDCMRRARAASIEVREHRA